MFLVKKNTKCVVIRAERCVVDNEMISDDFKDHVTTKDNVFDKHEVVLDPIGRLSDPEVAMIAGRLGFANSHYGFKSEDGKWIMLVSRGVKYLD